MAKSNKKTYTPQLDIFSTPPKPKPVTKPAPQKKEELVKPLKEKEKPIETKSTFKQDTLFELQPAQRKTNEQDKDKVSRDRTYLKKYGKLGLEGGNFAEYIANIRGNKIK